MKFELFFVYSFSSNFSIMSSLLLLLFGIILLFFGLRKMISKKTPGPPKEIIKSPHKPYKPLKNNHAEFLRRNGYLKIGDMEVKLWQYHTRASVISHMTWDKLKSVKIINEKSDGTSGSIVLSGTFQIPRQEIADYAAALGFRLKTNISKFTDYLVIGSEGVSPTKVANAIEVNNKGGNIKFIDENTFLEIIADQLDFMKN